MSGWTVAAIAAALFAIATIGLNLSMWLRHKALAAARGDWGPQDFAAALADRGCSPAVTAALRTVLAPWYHAALTPRPDDDFETVLRVGPDELEEIVEHLFTELALLEPTRRAQEAIPDLRTVGDLADHIQRRWSALRPA